MKIVADTAIPFLKGVLEPYADVVYLESDMIDRECLMDAEALITRTRTCCDRTLLEGTRVKMIATATIGTDHIDIDYCHKHGIFVANSAGSNAGGVMNYVFSALYGAASRKSIPLTGATMGIVGVGHVGSRVEQMARHLGFKVLLCDPPRAGAEGPGQYCSLDYLLQNSDIVTLSGSSYVMDESLDTLAGNLDPDAFFRISRSCIISEQVIDSISKLMGGRLRITLQRGIPANTDFTVSRARVEDFLTWLEK